MDLSILIVNWNTRELVADCLRSLPDACRGLEYEVIVVDNDSSDGSAQMVREEFPGCRLIEGGGNLGFARGNNVALEQASGDFLLLLNPDTVCPPDSLAGLVAFAQRKENLAAVGPRLVDAGGAPTITYGWFPAVRFHWLEFLDPLRLLPGRWCRDRVVHTPTAGEKSHPVEYVLGACFLVPRAALETVGRLDERYFLYFEETDWCLRARRLGLRVWYCADVEIAHLEGQAAGKASRFALYQFQQSYRLFVEKNYGAGRLPAFRLAQALEYGAKAIYRSLLPGDRPRNRALAAGYAERFRLQLRNRIDIRPPAGADSHAQDPE